MILCFLGAYEEPVAQTFDGILCVNVYPVEETSGVSKFMHYKDQILQGLKEGVVYKIPSAYDDFSVEVRVNPASADKVTCR